VICRKSYFQIQLFQERTVHVIQLIKVCERLFSKHSTFCTCGTTTLFSCSAC